MAAGNRTKALHNFQNCLRSVDVLLSMHPKGETTLVGIWRNSRSVNARKDRRLLPPDQFLYLRSMFGVSVSGSHSFVCLLCDL